MIKKKCMRQGEITQAMPRPDKTILDNIIQYRTRQCKLI